MRFLLDLASLSSNSSGQVEIQQMKELLKSGGVGPFVYAFKMLFDAVMLYWKKFPENVRSPFSILYNGNQKTFNKLEFFGMIPEFEPIKQYD